MPGRVRLDTDNKPVSEFRANAAELIEQVLRDVRSAVEQIEGGKGVPDRKAKAELRRRFGR